ncbi:tetratricopeptide repeat protein [Flavobacterium ardleyense]|uniref:Tetratricopeptide repeat protein n=1 Tax=Flavobacterium ardleyense TaxID=2038737 RepID=A0ABW5ZBP5_9FLAO
MSDSCLNHVETHWKDLTAISNEYYNRNDFRQGLSGYKDALYRAEVLNNNISDCIRLKIPFVQIYIISCNNLANTYDELDNKEEAENMLKRVVYYLLHIAANKELNFEEIQSELKRASLLYVRFAEKNNLGIKKQEQLIRVLKEELLANNFMKKSN